MNEIAKNFFYKSLDHMAYLASRWWDESEYENINDYKKNIQKFSDDNALGVTITKMLKHPFGCEYTTVGQVFRYTIKANGKAIYLRIS
jgi:hypothetical protein